MIISPYSDNIVYGFKSIKLYNKYVNFAGIQISCVIKSPVKS